METLRLFVSGAVEIGRGVLYYESVSYILETESRNGFPAFLNREKRKRGGNGMKFARDNYSVQLM